MTPAGPASGRATPAGPPGTALPEGVHLELDPSVGVFEGGTVLTGGYPGRMMVLSHEGAGAVSRLTGTGRLSEADRQLGRRLVTAGMAHPRLPNEGDRSPVAAVTVVVPVRDRSAQLDRCLAALGGTAPVVVVDDGSDDPAAIAEVCERHGVRLVRRPVSGGPGVARNEALAATDTELVAFVDSDCTVTPGWLAALLPMFADPELAAMAPRVRPRVPAAARSVLARFAEARSPLDMGGERGEVGPGRKVRYVPTAALVARRSALSGGFDPDLAVGEDVDLVWRLVDSGWHVRFEPGVCVCHDEPRSWRAWLRRRFRYGTSAAPLAHRHPGRLAPVELRAWPAATVAATLGRRPMVAGLLVLAATAKTARSVRGHGIPLRFPLRWTAAATVWSLVGCGRALTILGAPLVLYGATRPRWRKVVVTLAVAPPLIDWWRRRPSLDPLRWATACIVDDVAYGAGVWVGCLRGRTPGPLVPTFRAGQWDRAE